MRHSTASRIFILDILQTTSGALAIVFNNDTNGVILLGLTKSREPTILKDVFATRSFDRELNLGALALENIAIRKHRDINPDPNVRSRPPRRLTGGLHSARPVSAQPPGFHRAM